MEEALKRGDLRCLVATSSLELGIDMGAIDLVVQIESPGSVARGLQRIGRAGHQVGAPSTGRIFPKYRGDLVECAVVARRMRDGAIEETRVPRNALDVLSQQVVAACATDDWQVDDLYALVRRAYPYRELPRAQFDGVLDMLSGRYPSDDFAELRPRIVWDRIAGSVAGRSNARPLAVANAGTIPDRGLYGVFLVDGSGRVGELDEEMVYEARVGQVFVLGASSWRIERITRDRVLVSPAPGQAGQIPFWKGEAPGRPVELGRAIGAFVRETGALTETRAAKRLRPPSTTSTTARRATCGATCATSSTRPACCRPTARSWSSGSATRSATGGCASCRRSAAACTRRGRSRWARCCASGSARRRRRCGRTTASCCTCPTPTSRRPPTWSRSSPRRSRTWSCASWAGRRCTARGSARTRRVRC